MTYDLPPDFVVNLRNQDEVQGGVENTELICQLLGRASDDVAELDAIMHNKLARQPEKLRVWRSASRVERGAQREKKLANVVAVDPAVVQPKAGLNPATSVAMLHFREHHWLPVAGRPKEADYLRHPSRESASSRRRLQLPLRALSQSM